MRVVNFYLEGDSNVDREARAAENYADMFAQAFGCVITCRPAPPDPAAQGTAGGN